MPVKPVGHGILNGFEKRTSGKRGVEKGKNHGCTRGAPRLAVGKKGKGKGHEAEKKSWLPGQTDRGRRGVKSQEGKGHVPRGGGPHVRRTCGRENFQGRIV